MADDKRYNGWSSYESWCVNLWITNDEHTNNYWEGCADEMIAHCEGNRDDAAYELSQQLKNNFEENNPLPSSGVYTDLLSAALSEVNWYEIAEHFVDAVHDDYLEKIKGEM